MKNITITAVFDTSSEFLYELFLDSKLHSAITGSTAKIDNKVGGFFTAWDGYIKGKIIDLEKNKRIIQKWKTTDFNKNDKDSMVEIELVKINDKRTRLILKHSDLPKGTEDEYGKG